MKSKTKKSKILVAFIIIILVSTNVITLLLCRFTTDAKISSSANYSDEMKISHTCNVELLDGADLLERFSDHKDSPYYRHPDFYNLESSSTLTILSNFRTKQQTASWTCGPTCVMMVMDWFGKLGSNDETTLASYLPDGLDSDSTDLADIISIFEGVGGFDLYTTNDCKDASSEFTFMYIKKTLESGTPIMVAWEDWGGHWEIIIGYDSMGTLTTHDDVLIMADPYDSSDHNQDGYGIYSAERFISAFHYYSDDSDMLIENIFVVATPVSK